MLVVTFCPNSLSLGLQNTTNIARHRETMGVGSQRVYVFGRLGTFVRDCRYSTVPTKTWREAGARGFFGTPPGRSKQCHDCYAALG